MAKKTLDSKGRMNYLLDDKYEDHKKIEEKKINKELPSKNSNTLISLSIDSDLMEKVRAISYWEREFIKDIINRAIIEEVDKYEKINGEIKKLPKRK